MNNSYTTINSVTNAANDLKEDQSSEHKRHEARFPARGVHLPFPQHVKRDGTLRVLRVSLQIPFLLGPAVQVDEPRFWGVAAFPRVQREHFLRFHIFQQLEVRTDRLRKHVVLRLRERVKPSFAFRLDFFGRHSFLRIGQFTVFCGVPFRNAVRFAAETSISFWRIGFGDHA